MAFKMKGHTLPGFKQKKEGNMETVVTQPKRYMSSDGYIGTGATVLDDEWAAYQYHGLDKSQGKVHVATEAHDRGRLATLGENPGDSFGNQGGDVDIYDIGGKSVAVSNNYRNSMRDQGLINDADIDETYGYSIKEEEAILAKDKAKALAEGHKKGANYNN